MWPFHRRWVPVVGDTVLVNPLEDYGWDDKWATHGQLCEVEAVVDGTRDEGGYRIGVRVWERNYNGDWKKVLRFLRLKDRIRRAVVPEEPKAPTGAPPLVDARVLEEVVLLQKAVGGTDALIELLRGVREPYEIGKEDAS